MGGIDDAEEFEATMHALRIMGVTDEDLDSIWKVVSGVMLFGNMEFKQERNSDQAILSDDTVAQKVLLYQKGQTRPPRPSRPIQLLTLRINSGCAPLRHQRQRTHEGLPQAEDQGRQRLRHQGPDKGECRLRAPINEMVAADSADQL